MGEPMRLGDLIDAIEACPPTWHVYFDFCQCVPTTLASYRGFYDHLAIAFETDGQMAVEALLAELRQAVGNVFWGYKGGEYTMTENTPVWVANRGRYTQTAIVAVRRTSWCVLLETASTAG